MNQTLLLTKDALMNSNAFLTSIIVAIIIFLIGLILGGLSQKIFERLLNGLKVDSSLKKKTGLTPSVEKLLATLIQIAIYVTFTLLALNYVGLTHTALNIFYIVIIIIFTISIFLTLKDSIPNLVAGFFIRRKNKLKLRDDLTIEGVDGKIKEFGWFEVKVETANGDTFYIPNSLFTRARYSKKNNPLN